MADKVLIGVDVSKDWLDDRLVRRSDVEVACRTPGNRRGLGIWRAARSAREARMKFAFTKRAGKTDELVVTREDGSIEPIVCPKQGMIPHDMVHFAVEKVLLHQGFLTKVGAGGIAGFRTGGDDGAEAVERLVETMQAEVWSGPVPTDELLQLYETACRARNHPVLPVSSRQIDRIREEMADLARRWDAVPTNGSLVLTFHDEHPPSLASNMRFTR